MGQYNGPLLLTDPNALPGATAGYIAANAMNNISRPIFLFGGPAAVSDQTATTIGNTLLSNANPPF